MLRLEALHGFVSLVHDSSSATTISSAIRATALNRVTEARREVSAERTRETTRTEDEQKLGADWTDVSSGNDLKNRMKDKKKSKFSK